jgi:hypothetical protein
LQRKRGLQLDNCYLSIHFFPVSVCTSPDLSSRTLQ